MSRDGKLFKLQDFECDNWDNCGIAHKTMPATFLIFFCIKSQHSYLVPGLHL